MNKHHLELLSVKETAERLSLTQKVVWQNIDDGTFINNNEPCEALRFRWFVFGDLYRGPDQPEKLIGIGHEDIRKHDVMAEAQQILNFGLGAGQSEGGIMQGRPQ